MNWCVQSWLGFRVKVFSLFRLLRGLTIGKRERIGRCGHTDQVCVFLFICNSCQTLSLGGQRRNKERKRKNNWPIPNLASMSDTKALCLWFRATWKWDMKKWHRPHISMSSRVSGAFERSGAPDQSKQCGASDWVTGVSNQVSGSVVGTHVVISGSSKPPC